MKAFCAYRCREFSIHIAMGAHFLRSPVREIAVVHGKAIVVFEDGHDVTCARFFEEFCPCLGVEFFGLEHGDKVLVAKTGQRTVCCEVVFIDLGSFEVHLPGIPFTAECRNRVDAPVDEDAELCVLVPFGHFIV